MCYQRAQKVTAPSPQCGTQSDIQECDYHEKYGRQCPLYSSCYFSFACTSLDGSQNTPVKKISLEKDEIIYRNQIETECIYVVLFGIVTVFFYLPTGEPVVLENLGKGQTVGEMETYLPEKGPYNVKTLTSVTLCRLPLIYLTQIVNRDPSLMIYFLAASENAARSLSHQIWVMNAQRIYDRLARLLIVLSHLGLEKADGITSINVSHDDLAFLINTDRISITRSLHKLEREKLVLLDYKRIHITDLLITRFSEQGYLTMFV
jgi:CRP/FNR family transcriptional regulator, cyclic AMP receptor protein